MENINFKNKWQKFWWEVFSENDKPSSKRIVGAFMILCTQVCLVIEFGFHGGNTMVQDLFQFNLIIGASLLGISNITAIWKTGKIGVGNDSQKIENQTKPHKENKDEEEC
jgi:hypothetical protein